MRGPFFMSIGLHVLLAVAMVWASRAGELKVRALPSATVVKLIRPMAPALPKGDQGAPAKSEGKKPLEIPSDKKNAKKTEPVKPEPKKPEAPAPSKSSGERTGQAGTLRVSGGGFEYDFYLSVVQSKIEQNFRPPPGVRGQTLATVAFTIAKNGQISNVTLAKSAGNLLIDQAAERAIRAAGRFPPLPPQYAQGQLDIYFEFVVNPADGR